MRIAIVSGARPQFVKVAPLIREFQTKKIDIYHIHTGQHYDDEMSSTFFQDLEIPQPDINLEIGSATHGVQTGKMIIGLEEVLIENICDCIIVVGDTNSTVAAGITAIKLGIPIIHLEAGMRSDDWNMPEEINRILIDRISSLLITSTSEARNNLLQEGIDFDKILLTGDINVDSLYFAQKQDVEIDFEIQEEFFLATLHRQGNVDNKTKLKLAMKIFDDAPLPVLLPLHPRTRQRLIDFDLMDIVQSSDNIVLLPPLRYLQFIKLESLAKGILTDSGGVQKEAFILNVPCITLRSTTEWVETIEMGANRLIGIDYEKVMSSLHEIIQDEFQVTKPHPYGNGKSSVQIVNEIINRYNERQLVLESNIRRE